MLSIKMKVPLCKT